MVDGPARPGVGKGMPSWAISISRCICSSVIPVVTLRVVVGSLLAGMCTSMGAVVGLVNVEMKV